MMTVISVSSVLQIIFMWFQRTFSRFIVNLLKLFFADYNTFVFLCSEADNILKSIFILLKGGWFYFRTIFGF